MTYSVAIPAHNAASMIGRVIDAAAAASPAPEAIFVYDDASTDGTAEIAERHGAVVLRGDSQSPIGPARGRNIAAREVTSDYILFVDSDVVVTEDAPERLLREVTSDPAIAAAFGCYDANQAASNIAARYANLRHRYFHLIGEREAETFWTGLGLVRRSVFGRLEGFDRSIAMPAMEDIELGYRIRNAGYRVRLVPDATGTHLKNWTLKKLWRDDVLTRAIPWSKMIVQGRGRATLNAKPTERVRAVLALLFIPLVLASFLVPQIAVAALLVAIAYGVSNAAFFGMLARHGGTATAFLGPLLHWCYHVYASAAFASVALNHRLRPWSDAPVFRAAKRSVKSAIRG